MDQVVNMAGGYAPVGGQRLHGEVPRWHGDGLIVHGSSDLLALGWDCRGQSWLHRCCGRSWRAGDFALLVFDVMGGAACVSGG